MGLQVSHRCPLGSNNHLEDFYGERGENQVRIQLPYVMRLSWNKQKRVTSMMCHELVDSLIRIFQRVLDHYGIDGIRELGLDIFGGCLNVRKMRGGNQWSTHSWGIALDFDPENNQLKWGRDRATFAGPKYDKWWEIWESEGLGS